MGIVWAVFQGSNIVMQILASAILSGSDNDKLFHTVMAVIGGVCLVIGLFGVTELLGRGDTTIHSNSIRSLRPVDSSPKLSLKKMLLATILNNTNYHTACIIPSHISFGIQQKFLFGDLPSSFIEPVMGEAAI